MTRYVPGDENKTTELVKQYESDKSWLRHGGLAAELDRRLIQGATDAELYEVRPSWRAHVEHLRKVHRLHVEASPTGVWRILGAQQASLQDAVPSANSDDALGDSDDYDDSVDDALGSPPPPVQEGFRLRDTARALSALAREGLLRNELLKASVGMLVRQASESQHWHNCAHFRSRAAAEVIRSAGAMTASGYQSFCTKNLRHEHVVPNSVIYRMLCAANYTSADAIADLLRTYCIRATITRDEDRKLNEMGLASTMPAGFTEEANQQLFKKPLARYVVAGLAHDLRERPSNQLWHTVQ